MAHSDSLGQRRAIADRWTDLNSGPQYATKRWRNERARRRDGQLLLRLIKGIDRTAGPILDAPCGAGRLQEVLAKLSPDSVGLDLSPSMLRQGGAGSRIQGSAFELPFTDNSFSMVICCRLLHHLAETHDQRALLAELARVSSGWVAVSHWDAASWPVFRRRRGWRRGHDHRVGLWRDEITKLGQAAGLRRIRSCSSLRFVSPQTWTLFAKGPAEDPIPC